MSIGSNLRMRVMCGCVAVSAAIALCGEARAAHASTAAALRSSATAWQEQSKAADKPKVSGDEAKAAQKINSAPDAAAKLKAAGEFLKKYPKSSLRAQAAAYLAQQISAVADPAQKTSLAENFLTVFTEPSEGAMMTDILISTYVGAQRFEDAFRVGAARLATNPDDVMVLSNLAFQGIEQAQRGNPKFAEQSQAYALKAIELIEADKRPAGMEEAQWPEFKRTRLPLLYRALGVLGLVNNKPAEALPRLEKAASLDQRDPVVYYLISGIKNDEYQKVADLYRKTPPGPNQQELMKIINNQLDEIIDLYARTVALSEGRADLQPMHDQAVKDLESYYKFRHKSTEGMQQLISKYKPAPATP